MRPGSGLHLSILLLLTGTAAWFGPEVPAQGPLRTGELPAPSRAISPERIDAARALARAKQSIDRREYPDARSALARARAAAILGEYVELLEARLLLATGHPLKAEEAARRGLLEHAGRPAAAGFAELLAEAQLASGDEPGARHAWKLAAQTTRDEERRVELQQRIAASHERTGSLRADVPGDGEALVADESGLPLHLRSGPAQLRAAEELMDRGRNEDAIAAYEAALQSGLEPTAAHRAKRRRAHALFQIRRYDEARVAFATLLPDPEARFWHARSLARAGNPERAVVEFVAIGSGGDSEYGTWALYLAGTLLEGRGETDRAMALYEEVSTRECSCPARRLAWCGAWSRARP